MSFAGKYQRVSAENYEEFLKALDVNFMLRKAATVSTPTMEVSEREIWQIRGSQGTGKSRFMFGNVGLASCIITSEVIAFDTF